MKSNFAVFSMTVGLLGATFLLFKWSDRDRHKELARPLETIGDTIDGWSVDENQPLSPGVLERLTPTSYISRDYRRGNEHLGLFIAYYAQQRAGESMHSPKHCLPGSGWEIWNHETATIRPDGRPVAINKYYIQKAGQKMLVFYWYQSKDRVIANEYLGKILLVRDTIADGATAGSIARIVVADRPDMAAAALSFSEKILLALRHCFVA